MDGASGRRTPSRDGRDFFSDLAGVLRRASFRHPALRQTEKSPSFGRRGEGTAFLAGESMNEMRQMKVEDSRLFLESLDTGKSLGALRQEIAVRIAFLKSQAEPLRELPDRLLHRSFFRMEFMKKLTIKVLNFLSREERKNARVAAESLELIVATIETLRHGR